jgi:glycosyltransferase involved in cell wall biosynthesis
LKGISLHRKNGYDGIWSMMTYMVFPVVLMRMLGVQLPYLLTLQDGDPFERVFKRWYIQPFAPLLLYGIRHAQAIQTLSNYLATWARQCGYQGEVQVVPNGVDLLRYMHVFSEEEKQTEREKWGKKEGETWLVTTSRLVHKNAIDSVIRALVELPGEVHFAVFGIGPEEDRLKQLTTELHLEDRVHFFGHINQTDLPRALAAFDIFIRPSRSEGQGISFIEAMAMGIPVIATQAGGLSDFLFDTNRNPGKPTTGWAVDVDSPQQIAEAVRHIQQNPEQVQRVTKTAQEMVVKEYDWNLIASRIKALFEALCKVTPSPR